ncbi:DMT family transporter [Paucibacter sp. R3-3]|uniref:DMT family transporter n=1 Tax=Roseateles agri TaxID=3098619 RepID=A0ABU5DC60_9BURK|nr:DMT family transporter [Paucibacter sp. R3-3]MDY0743871.1 DMT family transporter [Paucibacter sp. R3-3]
MTTNSAALAAVDGMPAARAGQGLMVAGGLLLATVGVFLERAGQPPLAAVWFRCLFGGLALTAWGAWRGQLGELRLAPRFCAMALAAGLLMILNWSLFFAAIEHCPIGVATVVFHVQPLWVIGLAALLLGERVSRRQMLAAAVALAGLALASGLFEAREAWSPEYMTGLALCLGGSLSYAGVTLIARSAARGASSFALAWWQCAVGALVLAWWPLLHGLPAAGPAWGWLIGLGLLHTGLAYVLLYAGMARLSAAQVAVLQFVYPGGAVLVDWLVYGHALDTLQLAGVGLMAAALLSLRR